jgi:hypothetical protein
MDSIDSWQNYLTEALKILTNFSGLGLPQQIMFLVVLGAVTIILITMAILSITKYFKNEDLRREQAYQESLRIKAEQNKNLARLQQETTQAFMDNVDAAYKQDYEYYKDKITQGKYAAIWGKIPQNLQEEVASFVYKEDLKPEEKSAKIILIVRRK